MVTDTGTMFPDVATVTERIKDATLAAGSVFLDARYLSLTLLGSDQFANLFLTGVAYQNGTLPLPEAYRNSQFRIYALKPAGPSS